MTKPIDQAIGRLTATFGEPQTPNPDGFVREFRRAMEGCEAALLTAAVDRWIRRGKFWPRPGELIAEMDRIAAARPRTPEPPPPEPPPPTPEQRARMQAVVREAVAALTAARLARPSPPPVPWERGQREQFEAMQRASPNRALHRARPSGESKP